MSGRSFPSCWGVAGGLAFVAMCVFGYQVGPNAQRENIPTSETVEAKIDRVVPVTIDDLKHFGTARVFSFPLYQRLQSMDEWQVFELAMSFKTVPEPHRLSYDGRFSALVRRLTELSPDKAMAFSLSLEKEHAGARATALQIAGSVMAMNTLDQVLSFMPEVAQDRLNFLKGVVEGVPESAAAKIFANLNETPPELTKRLRSRFDGPSLLSIGLADPEQAGAAIRDIEDETSRKQAYSRLLERLGGVDLSKAIDLIESNADFEWGYALPVVGAFRQNSHATLTQILRLPPSSSRDRSLALLLEAPTGVDVSMANEVAAEIADETIRKKGVVEFAKRLAERDETAAIEFADQYGVRTALEESLNESRRRKLAGDLAKEQPLDALASVLQGKGDLDTTLAQISYRIEGMESEVIDIVAPVLGDKRSDALAGLLRVWADRDPAAALAAASDERLRSYKSDLWQVTARSQPLETIEAALASGDESAVKVAVRAGISTLAEQDSAAALRVFTSLLDDPVHASALSPAVVEEVSSALVRDGRAEDALHWAVALPENLAESAVVNTIDSGIKRDFDSVSQLLHGLQPGMVRDRGLSHVARAVTDADPVLALEMLLEVSEERRQQRDFDQLFKAWRKIDSEAASAAAAVVGING